QARAACQRERRKRIREYPHQKIGEPDSGVAVEAATACIASEKTGRSDFFLRSIKQHLSQFPRVAQSEIEALAGNRVQRLRGVSDRKNSGCGIDLALAQGKRESRAGADRAEISESTAKDPAQPREEIRIGKPEQLGSSRRAHAPHQGVAVPEREQSERPFGREAFPGDAGSRPFGRDFSDDGL